MATHVAAVFTDKGQPFEVQALPTPKPGPGELLIAVKSVALNLVDNYMRSLGLFITTYPMVIGFDVVGLVLEVGEGVPTGNAGDGALVFQPGVTGVAAYAASFWKSVAPDYGTFQERCIVPWQHAVPLPNNGAISWNQAATLPTAVEVGLNAWDTLGILRGGEAKAASKSEALLVWGASSSVGTMGVQSARLIREDPSSPFTAVYATAGAANHDYVSSLGADRVFDHKDPEVVGAIVSAAKESGVTIRHCFYAAGQLRPCQDVLAAFLGTGDNTKSKISAAPYVPPGTEQVDDVEVISLLPASDEETRLEKFKYWMGMWARENLANATVKPSPEPTVVGKELGDLNAGLDKLSQGVSCTKLVVQIGE
ncbi:GroES-like protein [Xylariaceae sp. FL0255]|nr:GroES-like protein [Xylariaceae sp. FL0255]